MYEIYYWQNSKNLRDMKVCHFREEYKAVSKKTPPMCQETGKIHGVIAQTLSCPNLHRMLQGAIQHEN